MKKQLLKISLLILPFILMAIAGFSQANTVTANVLNGKQTLYLRGAKVDTISIDGTFGANSDDVLPTQKAIKAYVSSTFVALTGNQTIAGAKTFNTAPFFTGLASAGPNDSILTIDPSTGQLHRRNGLLQIWAENGLGVLPFGQDTLVLGGFLIQNTTLGTAGFQFNINGLPGHASLGAGDSVLMENSATKQLFLVPTTLFGGGGGGTQTLQQVFAQQNAAVLTPNDTIDMATNTAPIVLKGNIMFAGPNGTYGFGNNTHVALTFWGRNIQSDGSLGLSIATGASLNMAINGVSKWSLLSTAQMQDVAYGVGTFTGTPAYGIAVDASGHFIETPFGSANFTRQTITSGTSATGTSSTNTLKVFFNFATTTSSYNFTFPASPVDGQVVQFSGEGTLVYPNYEITTLTLTPNAGQTVSTGPSPLNTLQAGESAAYEYVSSITRWVRIY